MPEYLSPGVYVEEVDTGPKPIEGVSTSTAGFVGMTRRGPASGLPVLVTSFAGFQRRFGGYFDFGPTFQGHNSLPYAIEGFFANGGQRAFIMRVKPTNATEASTIALGGLVTRLRENTAPATAIIKPVTLRGIHVGTTLQLRMIKEGVVTDSAILTVNSINRASGEVTLNANISATVIFEARNTTVFTDVNGLDADGLPTVLATPLDPRPNTFSITAKDEGSWGKEVVVEAFHESAAKAEMDAFVSGAPDNNKIRLKSAAGFYPNAWVEIDRGAQKRYRRVRSVDGTVLTLEGPALAAGDVAPQAPTTATIFSSCEFRLVITFNPTHPPGHSVTERFSGLTLENVPGRFYVDQINNGSTLIEVGILAAGTAGQPFLFPSGADGLRIVLDTGGIDGTAPPTDLDYVGTDPGPGKRTGIKALEDIDQISIIAAPGITTQVVQNALINQCEQLKDRFAILDPRPKTGNLPPDLNDIQSQRSLYDTKYAALYYPRIMVFDPLSEAEISVAPSGHIAGIYARTDIERGVHKAPANEVIRGITSLELKINKGEQDILNPPPNQINVLRDFRAQGRGLRVWGARVITGDSDWKYVNVRRLFIFLEESLDEGTQYAVFEPNDEPLWARIRQSISNFLTRVWRDGALQGTKPEDAFFVKCDRTTMTQDDIDNGRLIILIGVAPVKPAEFVIIRIGQFPGRSVVEEL
jgi:uncharacterized protein